jgi:hypothetical protein
VVSRVAISELILFPDRQNIAELGMKIEELRVIVSGNHQGVEHAVRRSPSVCRLQMESPSLLNAVPDSEYQRLPSSTASTSEDIESTTSSSERMARSYRHYHATMSNFSLQYSSRRRSHRQTISWNDDGSADEAASVRGLAPSTIRASDPSREEDLPSDKQSTISAISTSSWTRKWLEAQLSPEETTKALKRMQSTISTSQMSACETENSIVASDMQTFLEHIRYFMPVLADFDAEEKAIENDAQTTERSEVGSEANLIMQQHSPKLDAVTADEIPGQTADVFDSPGGQLSSSPKPTPESAYEKKGDLPSNELEYSSSGRSLSSSREERSSYCSGYSEERPEVANSGVEEGDMEWEVAEESEIGTHGSEGSSAKTTSTPQTVMGLSIYVEKHPHHRGTVICTPAADNALRVSHSFSQALTPELQGSGTYTSLPGNTIGGHSDASQQNRLLLHSMGARVFFVQRPTSQKVRTRESQDLGSESESEIFNVTGGAQVHMERSLRIVSAGQPQSKGKMSRRPTTESSSYDLGFDETATINLAMTDQSV